MTKIFKRWSVNAISEGSNPVTYYVDGLPLLHGARGEPADVSPVEHLLIGIAGCLALSCRAVFLRKHLRDINLEVVVTGEKSNAHDSGLSAIVIAAIFRGTLTDAEAAAIIEAAKPLCTVTNTVLQTPQLRYEIQAIRPRSGNSSPRYSAPPPANVQPALNAAPR